ncbi:DNA topoisomerase IV subunit B [Rhodothalassium salexigens DSM 2132]|uniref:DNA topoisomerase 4 subunit B n=1 Tax=Rhodothalassium salexigens DSM 2132 TaxID=1188247 RepID=A0A4R2PRE5_RHOSA|nr:DNA topoisomerase IV subunit B [Rhodothalassium salexigens]MBB4210235.1 topoisomerase-4 subunit B [Rhodothalassium salexigens DSM 2132]MBK1638675.1 DNA topoisomerase IV subunit B [Rhodothalassium salexigens DSM 2132]TCP38399.1 DNA topoisomerase IV subunit B [Rhodothalassium salexigens DSM 2132]
MSDLFSTPTPDDYSAKDIDVLEGLEPVRKRPGMYIGGTDANALHHLVAEVLDNAMDEAVAGHASRIEVALDAEGQVTVSDNGRGIPVDPHPKYPDKSALEVILTTLHSGGKFKAGAYATSGGLHGVGISVVNALSETLEVEVARDRKLYAQRFTRGRVEGPIEDRGAVQNRRGTTIRFRPDAQIFGAEARFSPARLYALCRSKAYLFRGVQIRWRCAGDLLGDAKAPPAEAELHFPGGLADYLEEALAGRTTATGELFAGQAQFPDNKGRVEWAIAWPEFGEGFAHTYCNTVPTPQGGTHEAGLRMALLKGLRAYGDLTGTKKAAQLVSEDVTGGAAVMLSLFIPEPQFQGQTKEKLATPDANRLVDQALRDPFDHWLTEAPDRGKALLGWALDRLDERQRRREEREVKRKTATSKRRLRLPGKLADCARAGSAGTEIFIVEGDSAGGSAKQARDRATQAVLPIRGKILNVASASAAKIAQNQEVSDLIQALGCGTRDRFALDDLRYEKVVIMCDADVDGAHIATLLMTFFFQEMAGLVRAGRLFLAQPPLYRLAKGPTVAYARDDAHREELLASVFKGQSKVEASRFKGLGEMPPAQLRETTMAPHSRTLLRVTLPEDPGDVRSTAAQVDRLMGRKPEARFDFIRDNADLVDSLDI